MYFSALARLDYLLHPSAIQPKKQHPVRLAGETIQILHGGQGAHLACPGITQRGAGAAGVDFAAALDQFLHQLGHGKMFRIQRLAFNTFAKQKYIDRVVLPKRKAFHTVSGSFELITMPSFIIASCAESIASPLYASAGLSRG